MAAESAIKATLQSRPLRSLCDATPGMCMHDARCNRQCEAKPRLSVNERELLRACHLSEQMSADQSVEHYRAGELPEPDDDADGNRAFRYFVAPVIAVFVGWLLWPVVSYFFK